MAKRGRNGDKKPVKKQKTESKPSQNDENSHFMTLGNTQLHPLLQGLAKNASNTSKDSQNEQKYKDKDGIVINNPRLNVKRRPGVSKETLNPYFDPFNLPKNDSLRKKKGLQFNEPGKYVEIANKIREKAAEEEAEKQEYERKQELGLNPKLSLNEAAYMPSSVPQIEWWDQDILNRGKSYDDIDFSSDDIISDNSKVFQQDSVTSYVQHPVTIRPPFEKHKPVQKPLYLTKKEYKRLRKNRRAEIHSEKQDKIKLGLEPAPAPKVKLSNLKNVLTNEMIKDPTAVETKVKREMEQRRLGHEAANAARKLSAEQRHQKEVAKFEKNIEQKGLFTAVFKILSLENKQHEYKVDINAKELNLRGVCIARNDHFSLVVVEGSELAVSKYKHIMMERIKWTENSAPKQGQIDSQLKDLSQNRCSVVWEGQLLKFHFTKWSFHRIEADEAVLDFLTKYKAENYFFAAASYN